MQAFAELPVVIIRAAIVVVINQSLTLPGSCITIYAEYLACAIYVTGVLTYSVEVNTLKCEYTNSSTI